MSGNNEQAVESIFIRSSAATNGITTLLIGAIVALVGTLIIALLPQLFFLVGILFLSGSIIAFVMGFYKLREPKYSVEINKQAIIYYHRKGQWQIPWSNVQRIDVPRVHKGLEHVDLEMIGIRLRQPEQILNSISPRLITHLLMEQRPLIAQFIMSNCDSGQCYGDDIIDDTKYKCEDGSMMTGVSAMFANRMRKLQQGLGYDVFVSSNDVDRSAHDFVSLLRECQETITRQPH
ncbi:MAG: DUF2982 domain-containing protein [Glaciecola sp.]